MFRAIRMCLRPKMDNGNITTRPLVSLGFALGTNFTSGIIPLMNDYQSSTIYLINLEDSSTDKQSNILLHSGYKNLSQIPKLIICEVR